MLERSFQARPARNRKWVGAALFLTLVGASSLSAGEASAQEDPRKAQSTPIFEEGLKLADRGRNSEALVKFRESYALYPSPNTLFNMARTEDLLGKKLEAIRHYRVAIANPILNPQAAERGKKYIAELEKLLGRVEVTGSPGQSISVSDVSYTLPLSAPIDVEPGPVVVKTDGGERTVEVAQGEIAEVDVTPPAPEGPAPNEPSALAGPSAETHAMVEPPKEEVKESFWGWRSVTGLSLLGVGALSLGAGALFAADESSEQDKVDTLGRSIGGSNSACTGNASAACRDLAEAKSSRDAASDRATVAFIGGGIAAGLGAVLVASAIIAPHRKSAVVGKVLPAIGSRYAGLTFRTEF